MLLSDPSDGVGESIGDSTLRVENDRLDEYDCEVDEREGACGRECEGSSSLIGEPGLAAPVGLLGPACAPLSWSLWLIITLSAMLVAGVGIGLRKVTFFPPSPDALTVRARSSYEV